ncbi:hypothetical protein ACEQUB_00937 [Ralstonia syzygii]
MLTSVSSMVVERGFRSFDDLMCVVSKISMPSAPSGASIVIDSGLSGMVGFAGGNNTLTSSL